MCSCFGLVRLFFEVRVVTGVGCATAFVLPGRASKFPSTLSSLQVYRGEVARGSRTNPCSSAQPVQWDWRMLNDRCECALDGFLGPQHLIIWMLGSLFFGRSGLGFRV